MGSPTFVGWPETTDGLLCTPPRSRRRPSEQAPYLPSSWLRSNHSGFSPCITDKRAVLLAKAKPSPVHYISGRSSTQGHHYQQSFLLSPASSKFPSQYILSISRKLVIFPILYEKSKQFSLASLPSPDAAPTSLLPFS